MTLVQVYKYCTASHCHYISHIQSFLMHRTSISHYHSVKLLSTCLTWESYQ